MKKKMRTVSYNKHQHQNVPNAVYEFFIKGSKDEITGIGDALILFMYLHLLEIDLEDKTDEEHAINLGFSIEYYNELFDFLMDNSLLYEVPEEVMNVTMDDLMSDMYHYIQIEHEVVDKCIAKIERIVNPE